MNKIISSLYVKGGPITREGLNFLSCLRRNRLREAAHRFVWFLERLKLRIKNSRRVLCECCGWQGNKFFPYLNIESGYYRESRELCPECYSKSRHRLLVRYMKSQADLSMIKEIRVLEVGAVKSFQDWLRAFPNIRYFSIDLEYRAGISAIMDVRQLGFLSKSFDIIICLHVLEHVREDTIALRELKKILRDDGVGFIQVPVDTTLDATIEYYEPKQEEFGHVRLYGKDLLIRLKQAGFLLNSPAINFASSLSTKEANQYGIRREDLLFLVSKV